MIVDSRTIQLHIEIGAAPGLERLVKKPNELKQQPIHPDHHCRLEQYAASVGAPFVTPSRRVLGDPCFLLEHECHHCFRLYLTAPGDEKHHSTPTTAPGRQ